MKTHLCIGLTGARYAVSKIDGKWALDEKAYIRRVQPVSWAGATHKRDLPWSVWGVDKIEDVFCPYPVVNGEFELIDNVNSDKWVKEWFEVTARQIEIENQFGIIRVQDLFAPNELKERFGVYSHNTQGIKSFIEAKAKKYAIAYIDKMVYEFITLRKLKIVFTQGNELNGGKPDTFKYVAFVRDVVNPTLKKHGLIPFAYGATFKIPFDDFSMYFPTIKIVKRFGLNGNDLKDDCITVRDTPAFFNTLTADEKHKITTIAKTNLASSMHEMKVDAGTLWGASTGIEFKIFQMSHSCNNVEDGQVILPAKYFAAARKNYGLSDDGAFKEQGQDGRPSGKQWAEMIKYCIAKKKGGEIIFEHCPENQDWEYQCSIVAAMEQAAFEATGGHSPNYHKYPMPPIEPVEPKPIPRPTPIPMPEYPKLKITWQGWLGLGVMLFVLILMAIAIF